MTSRVYFVLDGLTTELGDALQTLKDTFNFAISPEFRATFSGSGFTCVVALAQKQTLAEVQAALVSYTSISVS